MSHHDTGAAAAVDTTSHIPPPDHNHNHHHDHHDHHHHDNNLPDTTTETTPLLASEDTANDNNTLQRVNWFHPQTLSGLSILICLLLVIIGWILAVWVETRNNRYYGFMYTQQAILLAGQICFWTALLSLLNWGRLKRFGLEMPWFINILADFLIILTAVGTAMWYFTLLAANPQLSLERCTSWGGSRGPDEECLAYMATMQTLAGFAMGVLLLLAGTHACLFYLRIYRPPAAVVRLVETRPFERSRDSGREGWFVGFGRGPIAVGTAEPAERRRREEDGDV